MHSGGYVSPSGLLCSRAGSPVADATGRDVSPFGLWGESLRVGCGLRVAGCGKTGDGLDGGRIGNPNGVAR